MQKKSDMYDMSQHFRAPPPPREHLYQFAQDYQKQNRPAPHMRQMQQQQQQPGPENIRRQHMDDEEAIRKDRMRQLTMLKRGAIGKKRKSRHFVYSTYNENGKTYVSFERSSFVALILLLGVGIGILAIDARKALHFIGHTIRKAASAVTS